MPSLRRLLLPLSFLTLFLVRHHLYTLAFRILPVYVLWSSYASPANENRVTLSDDRDHFDTSFQAYDVNQWSSVWPQVGDGESERQGDALGAGARDVVPAVLHHILLGMKRDVMPVSWEQSRNKCLEFHPKEEANYTHYFWDDELALDFMAQHYPWFLHRWLAYRFPIQRADSLRYFVLHHFGGIFLDLDLECRRSLGPLRRFQVVNIAATPAGVSNGFMMASPRHPFLAQIIHSLHDYDRSYFGIPYVDIMFSTGPMALSAEHLRFVPPSSPSPLRILSGIEHHLSGRVQTPLFNHLGASSWHRDDAKFLQRLVRNKGLLLIGLGAVLVGLAAWRLWSMRRKMRSGGYERVEGGCDDGHLMMDQEEDEEDVGWTTRSDRLVAGNVRLGGSANGNGKSKKGRMGSGGGWAFFSPAPPNTPLSARFGLIRLASYTSSSPSEGSENAPGHADEEDDEERAMYSATSIDVDELEEGRGSPIGLSPNVNVGLLSPSSPFVGGGAARFGMGAGGRGSGAGRGRDSPEREGKRRD